MKPNHIVFTGVTDNTYCAALSQDTVSPCAVFRATGCMLSTLWPKGGGFFGDVLRARRLVQCGQSDLTPWLRPLPYDWVNGTDGSTPPSWIAIHNTTIITQVTPWWYVPLLVFLCVVVVLGVLGHVAVSVWWASTKATARGDGGEDPTTTSMPSSSSTTSDLSSLTSSSAVRAAVGDRFRESGALPPPACFAMLTEMGAQEVTSR